MSPSVLYNDAVDLLKDLIVIESFSRNEDKTAQLIEVFLRRHGVVANRKLNNVWAYNQHFNNSLPTILLNSHHDTVKPHAKWTKNPFEPVVVDGKLYGLGSNDAGGALVSLIATFLHFYRRTDLKYNLLMTATAEEEISGINGVESILPQLGKIDFAIVGEPTQMQMAIAEKGLLVIDCHAKGKAGHAAREEGENAIYIALDDINWFRSFKFDRVSEYLGPIKMSVTIVKAGSQHNVVPDSCEFTVDIRVTEEYTHQEILDEIRKHVKSEVIARSVRLKSSSIAPSHPIVRAGLALDRKTYGSPTTSDQAVLNLPSLKMGPGDSARSHTADEFIFLNEIKEGIELYIKMLEQII